MAAVRAPTNLLLCIAVCAGVGGATGLARADVVKTLGPLPDASYHGRYRFIFVGASMTDNTGLDNGVNCLKDSATSVVAAGDVPSRARLVQATLFLTGSLLDDGIDYNEAPYRVFDATGLNFNNPADLNQLYTLALQDSEKTVEFTPPGALTPTTVTAVASEVHIAGFYQDDSISQEVGNVAFFISPIDVTDVIKASGKGLLEGSYKVSGLRADVCKGKEAVCSTGPSAPTCSTQSGSAIHTKGTASWALLLVLEDPALPVVSISVYQGLQDLIGPAVNPLVLNLSLGQAKISNPAAGSLGVYVIEGDLRQVVPGPTPPFPGHEYIEVDGDADPSVNGYYLHDDINPYGNLFNSTINTQQSSRAPDLTCSPASDIFCCNPTSDRVCGEAGVDIDVFNISTGLTPGGNTVRLKLDTGADRVALAVVVMSINVFEAILAIDTQVRVPEALFKNNTPYVQLGAPFEYNLAVSNTGNAPATLIKLIMDAPAFTQDFEIVTFPKTWGADNLSHANGGKFGNGIVRIEGFSVNPGEVAETTLRLRPTCEALNRKLEAEAVVEFNEGPDFAAKATTVTGAGPGVDECFGVDPLGPFAAEEYSVRHLRGGGALSCSGSPSPPWSWLLLALWLAGQARPRRRRCLSPMALLGLAVCLLVGCGKRRPEPEPPDPLPDRAIHSLDGLPGMTCGSQLMVVVRHENGDEFCIDRFEATYDNGALGDVHQGLDDTDLSINFTTTAKAQVALGVKPATMVSWYQAKALCENASKRLCSQAEWERACRGPTEYIYPYGDNPSETTCNGYFNFATTRPSVTGSLSTCGSAFGAYDMSGNVIEWVADAVPRDPSQTQKDHRFVRGGGFRSNESGLACFGAEFHLKPGTQGDDLGFRCCKDKPN